MTEQLVLPLTIATEQPLEPEQPWGLPLFDPDRVCAKCACEDIHVQYHDGVATYEPCYAVWRSEGCRSDFPEHFDVHCRRCGYQWCEATLG
jgi:hypothetical protein